MKKYKQKDNYYFYFSFNYRYYIINNIYNGLFYSLENYTNDIIFKGYYNMDIKYSHWVKFDTLFNYYL